MGYHDDEWAYDADGNPEWIGPPKEEPDCGGCNDRGTVTVRGLSRLWWWRSWRPCPWCRPTLLAYRIWRCRWAVTDWWRRHRRARPGADMSEEAPF